MLYLTLGVDHIISNVLFSHHLTVIHTQRQKHMFSSWIGHKMWPDKHLKSAHTMNTVAMLCCYSALACNARHRGILLIMFIMTYFYHYTKNTTLTIGKCACTSVCASVRESMLACFPIFGRPLIQSSDLWHHGAKIQVIRSNKEQ